MTKPNDLPVLTEVVSSTKLIVNSGGALYQADISEMITDTLGTIATQDADAVTITGGSITGITDIAVADGGTGASTAAGARTNLGVAIGSDVQSWNTNLDNLAGFTTSTDDTLSGASDTELASSLAIKTYVDNSIVPVADGDKGDITVSSSGAVWTIDSDSVTYDKMQDTSGTDVLLGRSTAGAGTIEEVTCTAAGRALLDDANASAQRTTLGLAIGADVLAYNAEIQEIADLSPSGTQILYYTGGAYTLTDMSSFGASLIDDANASAARTTLGLTIGTDVLAYDLVVQNLADLTLSSNDMIYSTDGTALSTVSTSSFARGLLNDADASARRTSIGLGSIATQDSSNVTITGGSITGITDIAVADGGTGASTAAGARTSLDVYSTSETYTQAEVDALLADVGWTYITSQATTSGGSFDFTIPAGAQDVEVFFEGVSLGGTDQVVIQLGDSGGIETTGYRGSGMHTSTGALGAAAYTTSFRFGTSGAAANQLDGIAFLKLGDSSTNKWFATGQIAGNNTTITHFAMGRKALSAELTTVRITRSGTNGFDAGEIFMRWR